MTTSEFLSTPSARRATQIRSHKRYPCPISIHALREEGDVSLPLGIVLRSISIHALREEGDPEPCKVVIYALIFLSTPSARRATAFSSLLCGSVVISIHALREEGDMAPLRGLGASLYFYPRPPRGGRPEQPEHWNRRRRFLSTPSARRATPLWLHPRRGKKNFYPRPPRGGRPTTDW